MEYLVKLIIKSRLLCDREEGRLLYASSSDVDQFDSDLQKISRVKFALNQALLSAQGDGDVVASIGGSFYRIRWDSDTGVQITDLMSANENVLRF